MSQVGWTVTESSGERKVVSNLPKLAYSPPFEVTDKMPKGQQAGAILFNAMRERLILVGEMEEK